MEELVAGTLDSMISGADKHVLVDTVRLIQQRGLSGCRGGWKEFLNSYDRKFGDTLCDPSKRSVDLLAAFLKSFNQTKDLMFIGKLFRYFRDRKALEKYITESLDKVPPEQRLVRLTMEHPYYRKHYTCHFYNKDWLVVPLGDISKAMKPNSMICVDCEMVLCHDGTEEVVKICVVDAKLKVKLEKFVNPNKPVADYRTHITGVSAEDLVGVTKSLVDIQEKMKKLLKTGTILVGHSVHSDLRALKISYHQVIDTSYIFKYSEMPATYTPSLNNLCKDVLGYEVRKEGEPHDCRRDAEAAMKLVLTKLEQGFDDPIKVMRVPVLGLEKLLLHKIPVEIPCEELQKVFPQDIKFDIQADLKIRGPFYSTHAVFKDACEASNAFQRAEGYDKKDNDGRPQKLVFLKLSTGQMVSFYIRKMMAYSPLEDGCSAEKMSCDDVIDSKRPRASSPMEADEGLDPKVRKTNYLATANNKEDLGLVRACSSKFCEHVKEIDRLKQELSAREDEIFNLQKILADLTGEHYLSA